MLFKIIAYICAEIRYFMKVVSHKKLVDFYQIHNKAKIPIENWYSVAKYAKWKNFSDIKHDFNTVDSVGNQRYVFNIKGNDYRLVVVIQFAHEYMYIRFVGTHAEYDRIDSKTI